MRKITALREGKGRQKRVNVFLDGRFAFSLAAEVAAREDLGVAQELPENRIAALAAADRLTRGYQAATRLLSYRPRSEAEVRAKLQQRGMGGDTIQAVISRLKEAGLLDDAAFARFWRDNREAFRPRSQWLTRAELRQKGVAPEIIVQVTAQDDDRNSAYQAALSKLTRLPRTDYTQFRSRLGQFLRRRGFNYGVIEETVTRLWQEAGNRPE